jgi:hypothetical protein
MPITPARTQGKLFQCYDPDGNIVELFEVSEPRRGMEG